MALACEITPLSAFLSTNLNNKIETFDRLGDRIKRSLGYPLVSLEIHTDQLRENIQIAAEYFTKYAGYTQEYLIFDSGLYETNKGIRLDLLYTLTNTDLDTNAKKVAGTNPLGPGPEFYAETAETVFVATNPILSSTFASSSALSATFTDGIAQFELFDKTLHDSITAFNNTLSGSFTENARKTLSYQGSASDAFTYQNVYDYDVMDYRKVIEVTDFEEGSSTGINTLFTLEQTLAQQTYFRYPQPKNHKFYGVISCYVERALRDVIKEQWVYEYALALSMITIGRVRGKFGSVSLLGGGALNYDLLQEGVAKKTELEQKLLEGASPGMGDNDPTMFIVG